MHGTQASVESAMLELKLLSGGGGGGDHAAAAAATSIRPALLQRIEARGVSAAFLQHFTATELSRDRPDLAKTASRGAAVFLRDRLAKLKAEIAAADLAPASEDEDEARRRTRRILTRNASNVSDDLARRRSRPYLTARDVHTHVIVPSTCDRMVRYIELRGVHDGRDAATGRPYVGEAVHFFSYSWDSPWQDVVDALVAHTERAVAEGIPEPYYWIDVFAVNQHLATPPWKCTSGLAECPGCAAVASDMHDWKTADPNHPKGFERVIACTRHTLVLMEPWDSPRPPTRVWCLFEQYTTIVKDGVLEVVLSPDAVRLPQHTHARARSPHL